jgi:hypothetical protein
MFISSSLAGISGTRRKPDQSRYAALKAGISRIAIPAPMPVAAAQLAVNAIAFASITSPFNLI